MASPNRSTTRDLVTDLINHSRQYSFFQAVKLLSELHRKLQTEQGRNEVKKIIIRFSTNPALDYNACDIDSINIEEDEQQLMAAVNVNFMGLYGAASPIPVFYTESILQADEGEDNTRAFMDLFNHRLISLVYRCWEKYRYYQQYKRGNRDNFSNWMFALSGLYQKNNAAAIRSDQDIQWERLLPFSAILGMRCHSVTVMESVLRSYFKWDAIHIKTNIKRYIELEADQRNKLGMQCATLSDDFMLGKQVEDRAGKFRIVISRLSYSFFCQFLPDGELNRPLKKLVTFILRDQLEYDIELKLLKPEIPKLVLGQNTNEKLGYTSWIGHNRQEQQSLIITGC